MYVYTCTCTHTLCNSASFQCVRETCRLGNTNTAMLYQCFLYAGMDLFASCLWHLRCDVELSVITETLMTSDPCRVEGLCAKATSLNLSRDHEGAVKCLQKAITVSSLYVFAYTVSCFVYCPTISPRKKFIAFQC